jgi:GcrA cell cycle regulator
MRPDDEPGFRNGLLGRQIVKWSQRLMNFVDQKRPEPTRTEITWTDDRVELLKRLWSEGLSASQIAGELGGITRNAVIGKVHRLGLSGRAKAPSSSVPRPRKPRVASQIFRPARPMVRGNTALAVSPAYEYDIEPEPQPIENIIPLGQRCTLLELNDEKCHWPVGDPGQSDFYFCGGKTGTGIPYCGYHARVAYQPPAARRDRKPARV